jgi:hypothetical protein
MKRRLDAADLARLHKLPWSPLPCDIDRTGSVRAREDPQHVDNFGFGTLVPHFDLKFPGRKLRFCGRATLDWRHKGPTLKNEEHRRICRYRLLPKFV